MRQDKLSIKDFIRIVLVVPLMIASLFLGIVSCQLLFEWNFDDFSFLSFIFHFFITCSVTTYLFIRVGNDSNYLKTIGLHKKHTLLFFYIALGLGFLYLSMERRIFVNNLIISLLIFIDIFFLLKSSKKVLKK